MCNWAHMEDAIIDKDDFKRTREHTVHISKRSGFLELNFTREKMTSIQWDI